MVAAALFAGLGAVCRFLVDTWVNGRNSTQIPLGTCVVNISACLLMGMVTGYSSSHGDPGGIKLLLGSGFLGGYSTFSTASVEGMRLLDSGEPLLAAVHTLGMVLLGVGAGFLGMAIARGIS